MPNALHPKAASFVRQNLFSGVEKFTEIEARISELPDEKSRGDAFEVFAEAYLATQRKYDSANVWPLSAVPSETLQSLALRSHDCGVDGVFSSRLGYYSAYQVKFRSNRPSLTWRELSTFIGLADSQQIRSRVLITNCDELPSVLNDRQGFFCIRGSDLDRLEAQDFRAIEAWLADTQFVAPKKQPRPHQSKALDALIPALEKQDRVTAIMACGTGKTLVALWVAERLQAKRILVLLPSLALLRQVLHEWLHESSLPDIAYLCVCSDPTVKDGIDSLSTLQSDLDFEVSTESSRVREFLDAAFNGTKIIFSTYQSASVIGEALKHGESFDFAVFDEAHKTAGREGRNFAFALDDARLPIRKRLFLTATPRHYNPLDRDREGEARLVLSMDNPEVYGEQAFQLTFAEAARLGIICRYKVLISVITSDEVSNELLNRGEVLVEGETMRAREVANHIALRNAVKNHGARHIFTFHRTVRDAREFIEPKQGIGAHLEDFSLFHVNGNMSAAQRERVMRDFRSSNRGLISNARCLTEGVDVPAVDMVAFLSPRRSLVDIVQAIGRAMRTSPATGKEFGYVLVPLFIDITQGESVEDAVARAQFDEVWDIIQTLQEQDEALAEQIQQLAEFKGRTGKFDAAALDAIEFCGEHIGLETLNNSVSVRVFDDLFVNWDVRYGELLNYKQEHGNCLVPKTKSGFKKLALWVRTQRENYAAKKLSQDRFKKLNDIDFEWNPHDSYWDRMFAELNDFKIENGNCRVPAIYRKSKELGIWVSNQRSFYKRRKLSQDRIKKLESIGFDWEPFDNKWEKMFEELKNFKSAFGHIDIPQRDKTFKKLGVWLNVQRIKYSSNKISEDRAKRLELLGIEWSPLDKSWDDMFQKAIQYKLINGNLQFSKKNTESIELAYWISRQRKLFAKGGLAIERITLLESIGVDWNPILDSWERNFQMLLEFKDKNGHCRVPYDFHQNKKISHWVSGLRKKYSSGSLPQEQIFKLESIGFEWNPFDFDWEKMFLELVEYNKIYGNCLVPKKKTIYKKLGIWVGTQRQSYSKNKLSPDQVDKLNSLEFDWNPFKTNWEKMYEELKAFQQVHGHCRVPQSYSQCKSLGLWVSRQRKLYSQAKLSANYVTLLNSLQFEWNPETSDWEMMFDMLEKFKAENGHCRVPMRSLDHKKLKCWVGNQRQNYRKGKLCPVRIKRLEDLGFIWKVM